MLQNCRIQEPPNLCYPVSDKIINIPVLFCNTAIMTIFMCLQKVYSNTTEDIAILPYYDDLTLILKILTYIIHDTLNHGLLNPKTTYLLFSYS